MKNNNKTWNGKSRGGSFGYHFFVFLLKISGIRGAYLFLSLVTVYFIPCAPKATSAIWWYNRNILKYGILKSVLKLYLHFYTFGQTLIDKIAIGSGQGKEFEFEFDNYSGFLQILNSGSGVILIGAHVGCWEIGSTFFGDYAKRMNIVMYDNEYRKIKEIVDGQCTKKGYKIIPTNDSGIESLILMKKALDNGEYLCFQGDRFVTPETAVSTGFASGTADFPKGPFILAEKFKVPVVFYYSIRGKGRKYKFLFTILNPSETEKSWNRRQIMESYIHSLENIICKYPQQWFNFYKFWR